MTEPRVAERQAAAARFANDLVWQRAAGSAWSRLRIEALLQELDLGTRSLLDVGCGDGQVARAFREHLGPGALVVGLDRGRPGLMRFWQAGQPLAADADALPFVDRAFDLVLASEVLEHLPDDVLRGTVRELMRVARREIIVSVPNREDLVRELMRCPCGATFNAFGHLHSFDLAALDALFCGFVRVSTRTAGPRRRYASALLALRHAWGRYVFEPTAVCPACGGRDFPNREHDPLRLLCDALNVVAHPRKRDGYWLMARYQRPTATQPPA